MRKVWPCEFQWHAERTPVCVKGISIMIRNFHLCWANLLITLGLLASNTYALEISYTYDSMNRISSAAYREGLNTTFLNYQYDAAGNMTKFWVTTSGPPLCGACVGDPVILKDTVFTSDAACECKAKSSITIGAGVTFEKGAEVIFKAPKVVVEPGATIPNGVHVEIKQQ
jgi:hypothetical protein